MYLPTSQLLFANNTSNNVGVVIGTTATNAILTGSGGILFQGTSTALPAWKIGSSNSYTGATVVAAGTQVLVNGTLTASATTVLAGRQRCAAEQARRGRGHGAKHRGGGRERHHSERLRPVRLTIPAVCRTSQTSPTANS